MSDWWTYRPQDLLLFSERVYWRLFELHNAALWPWPVIALLLGLTIMALVLVPRPGASRLSAAILAVAWLVVAWAFFWSRYQTVNWAAAYVAPFFALEAVLLAFAGGIRGTLDFRARGNAAALAGFALFAYAVALHPFIAVLDGRPLSTAEIFAVAPDPTAIATLGLLSAAGSGRIVWWLIPVPAAWCVVSWATLLTMGTWEAWIPLAALAFAFVVLLLRSNAVRERP